MIKADLNGSKIEVIKCNDEHIVGTKGIVAKETARTFVIITKDNSQKMLLKGGAVFRLKLPITDKDEAICIDLWGDMLKKKGSERTKANFKERGPLNMY